VSAAIHLIHHTITASVSLGTTLATLATGGVIAVLSVWLTSKSAEGREARSRTAAAQRDQRNRDAVAELQREQREADLQRERLAELRPIIDDAVRAMGDLWTETGVIVVTSSRVKYNKPELHLPEERPPDAAAFLDAYNRLRDASNRLLQRVTWDDTLHSPVGRTIVAAANALNAVQREAENPPLSDEASGRIHQVNAAAQHGYRELRETARERFAPGGLAGSQREVTLILRLRQAPRGPIRFTNPEAERFLGPLRGARHAKVLGPDKDGRVVIRDAESEPGEALARLEADLDAMGSGWRQVLELNPPPQA
jgi:hypothetical protein